MKKLVYGMLFLGLVSAGKTQDTSYHPRAIEILDKMTETIGELSSCSFQLKAFEDLPHEKAGFLREYAVHDVYLVGPDKMHIFSKKPKNKYAYWYNGDIMMYYSFSNNHYGFIETPDNIRETIELVNAEYDIDFPAADFFYPTLTDDLMQNSHYIGFEGLTEIDGQECYYIVARGKEYQVHLWINSSSFMLPLRYLIQVKKNDVVLNYEGIFSNWQINPNLPDALFDFTVPADARRLQILPKSLR